MMNERGKKYLIIHWDITQQKIEAVDSSHSQEDTAIICEKAAEWVRKQREYNDG